MPCYFKANPGDLHYGKDFANDGWGERGQLKCQRNQRSIEIYSDIAYAAGSGHRSIQGVAVFFAGSPIAWQSSQQPFATHSTAESELVSYCESLLIGRATEALLCSMWGEPLDGNSFTRTIYGDNMAAIGLASGNTCASWRTRHLRIRAAILKEAMDEHLRIRAAILKEAMDESCMIPGGVWRLLHLKGSELVADGLTKQLLGQSFERFREDLGLGKPIKKDEKVETTSTTMTSSTAIRVLTVGSVLVSHAKAMSNATATEDEDLSSMWTVGIILMILGAIYAMQLLAKGVKCCVRRLWRASGSQSESTEVETTSTSIEQRAVDVAEAGVSGQDQRRRIFRDSTGESMSASTPLRSSSQSGSGAEQSLGSASRSGSMSATSRQSATPSGLGDDLAVAATLSMPSQSGLSNARSLKRSTPSGSQAVAASSSTSLNGSRPSGSGASSTLKSLRHSGSAAAVGSVGSRSEVSKDVAVAISPEAPFCNLWNEFQKAHRGLGWGSEKMRSEYYKAKSEGKLKMP
eukprot:s601_g21.t1